ncbi:DinB family protein [Paenibacillus piri]|uniref:DinB family protein n=1 Tax=Paenibacillus piri TaxID=2547395 RepID=A0A4R5KK62_9BACL|nr:DinB family protein [Paenibacillus piri]TDF95933.1 DinB family protein [Paenibacillus piri]
MLQATIQTALTARQIVIGSVQAIPESLFDVQPQGASNTIRWNIGHQITMLNWFLAPIGPVMNELPETYNLLFISGTKPSDWTIAPPGKEELLERLSAQFGQLMKLTPEALNHTLNKPLTMGPLEFRTAAEAFSFAFIHEAVHLGVISSLVKQVNQQASQQA